MTFTVKKEISWQESEKYIKYLSKLDLEAEELPVWFYSNEGDNICIIKKNGNNLTVLFSSMIESVSKKFDEVFDPECMSSLEDEVYAVDFINSTPILKNGDNTINFSKFTIIQPTNMKDYRNLFFISNAGKWYKCWASTNDLPTSLFVLYEINKITESTPDLTLYPTHFSLSLLSNLITNKYALPTLTYASMSKMLSCIVPKLKITNLNTEYLCSRYENIMWGEELPNSKKIKGKKKEKLPVINLSVLLRNKEIPKVDSEVRIELDMKFAGVHYMGICPNEVLKIVFDKTYTSVDYLKVLFSDLNIINLMAIEKLTNETTYVIMNGS